jgi:hypothetical protein
MPRYLLWLQLGQLPGGSRSASRGSTPGSDRTRRRPWSLDGKQSFKTSKQGVSRDGTNNPIFPVEWNIMRNVK